MKSGLPLRAYLASLVLGVTLPLVALLGFFVSSGVPVEVVYDEMRRDPLRIILVIVVILALISVFSYRFMRAITASMESIAMAANAVASGDPDARATPDGPREMVAVATRFNAMLDA
jgi:methyl-accepting chemotaxis protein